MALHSEHLEALAVAVLATYNYSMERSWGLLPALRVEGLLDPRRVAGGDAQEVGNRLKAAGYDRGGVTYIIAPRFIALMDAVVAGRLDSLPSLVAAGDRDGVAALVCTVKGMGPKSARIAWELLSTPSEAALRP